MSACSHAAAVSLTPEVMTCILKAWSTAGSNAVTIETKCTECGADIRVALVKHTRGEGGGQAWSHVEAFPHRLEEEKT